MNTPTLAPSGALAAHLAAPSMLSLKPAACSALRDPFMGDWSPDHGLLLAIIADADFDASVPLTGVNASMAPAPAKWIGDRLTLLWTMFMVSRHADPRALAVWIAETSRLLIDIPHDILSHSIDAAIKSSRHGFMPSVGEIRAHADPMVSERRSHIARLERMWRRQADAEAMGSIRQRADEIRASRREGDATVPPMEMRRRSDEEVRDAYNREVLAQARKMREAAAASDG